MTAPLRRALKDLLGPKRTVQLRSLLHGQAVPRWGNLRRTRPFSTSFGFDRGTPVDRYYIEKFFAAQRDCIRGDVLEIQASSYTQRFGREVRVAHSVDANPLVRPTVVCDLAESAGVLPSDGYDCFLLPSTLQHLQRVEPCLRQALRVIKPGGVILATAAAFVPLIPDGPDYWRLSADGWRDIAARVWPGCEVHVEAYGNCLAAVAAMWGLAAEELTPAELDAMDPRYPVVVAIRCRKPMGAQ